MTTRAWAALREAPATIPALVSLALFCVWGADQAGYPLTHWAPGALVVLALLAMTLAGVRVRVAEVPVPVRVALLALGAYTAFSFLSIIWAGVPADAWEGANRTLLYLAVFALFASWRQTGRSASLLLCAWVLAMAAIAAIVALHVDAAGAASLRAMMPGGRLIYPAGYANAAAAEWLMAAWPALMLARSERLAWPLRGLLAAGAVLLCEVALLSQSRGSLYATPVMLVLAFALLPGRTRTFALLVPVAAGIAAAAPTVLRVGNHTREGSVVPATLHSAVGAMFIAALVVGVVVAAAAAAEARLEPTAAAGARVRRVVGACALAALIAAVAGGLVAAGDPVTRVRHAWDTFKSPRGYAANAQGSRLTSGLGSQRYDFYRVSLDEFLAHPLIGIGADNFQQQYLAHGRSGETPRYPHSIEMRALAETGLIGAALLLTALVAAVAAGMRAVRSASARSRDPLAAAVAAAALTSFGYWLVHGSFDWFFEFAGLGAPAFAMLGLAAALAPRRQAGSQGPKRRVARPLLAMAGAALLAAVLSLLAPWLSGLEINEAARTWPRAPLAAYSRLDDAAGLDPLGDEPYLLSGSIALRFGDLARARHEFSLALGRVPGDAYATLELGAIASTLGQRASAANLLARAVRLEPRDPLAQAALAAARGGRTVEVDRLNRAILVKADELR